MSFRDARFLADVGKGAVTVVSIERMASCGKPARAAFNGNTSEIAIGTRARNGRMLKREAHVIGDK